MQWAGTPFMEKIFTHKFHIINSQMDLNGKRTLETKQDKQLGIAESLLLATWNIRGLCHKENILDTELEGRKIDVISETKKKLRGPKELDKYLLYYSEVEQEKRAVAGVVVYVKRQWKNRINSYCFINKRILTIRIRIDREYMTIIAVYAPEKDREKESKIFYQNLQEVLDKTNNNDIIMLVGDFNAQVGNVPIQNVVGTNGERTKDRNGNHLIDFASYNELKILNTFYKHKDIHKIT